MGIPTGILENPDYVPGFFSSPGITRDGNLPKIPVPEWTHFLIPVPFPKTRRDRDSQKFLKGILLRRLSLSPKLRTLSFYWTKWSFKFVPIELSINFYHVYIFIIFLMGICAIFRKFPFPGGNHEMFYREWNENGNSRKFPFPQEHMFRLTFPNVPIPKNLIAPTSI